METTGIMGNFTTTLMTSGESLTETVVEHGATIIATGGKEYTLASTCTDKIRMCSPTSTLDAAMDSDDPRLTTAQSVAFMPVRGVPDRGAALLQPAVLYPHRQERPERSRNATRRWTVHAITGTSGRLRIPRRAL